LIGIKVKCDTRSYPVSTKEKDIQQLSKEKNELNEKDVNLILIGLNDYENEF
jgi:hypothetical protein